MLLNNDYPTKSNLLIDLKKKCELTSKSADGIIFFWKDTTFYTLYPHLLVSNAETLYYLIKVKLCVRNFILTIIQWECYEDDFINKSVISVKNFKIDVNLLQRAWTLIFYWNDKTFLTF